MAKAFFPGDRFKFKDKTTIIYEFISIEFSDSGLPIINYVGVDGEKQKAYGYYLTDLIHA